MHELRALSVASRLQDYRVRCDGGICEHNASFQGNKCVYLNDLSSDVAQAIGDSEGILG